MALWWPGRHRLILTMHLQVFKIILHSMGQMQDVRQIRPAICQSETWGRLARGSEHDCGCVFFSFPAAWPLPEAAQWAEGGGGSRALLQLFLSWNIG